MGKGGFAKVFLAKVAADRNKRVAIKVVPRKRIAKPEQDRMLYFSSYILFFFIIIFKI